MTFDRRIAVQCAEAIKAVYSGALSPTFTSTATDTQVRVEQVRPGTYIVIFPGTDSVRDWLTDLRVRKTNWHGAKVHRGFVQSWTSVAGQVLGAISGAHTIIITGHSLGGALATLCADAAADMGVEVEAVYTFGSPRVGNGSFARQYNDDLADVTCRVVNARDPVPHVPWMLGTYRHVDTQIYLGAPGTLQIDEPWVVAAKEAAQSLATITTDQTAKALFDIAEPHSIRSYLGKLKGLQS
jgi:predicted alpha/beta-hydrolase family hydrolase